MIAVLKNITLNLKKISIVSNLTTTSQMKVYLFRNYNLPTSSQSQYEGTVKYKVWEAVRASSAAPGYYEDFKLDGYIFHDGGILANNPTAIAIHEAKQLWPNVQTNCIVSIGNGRFRPSVHESQRVPSISLKQKINRIVAGVSCTQTVHNMLIDLLPTKVYFRFNPFVTEEFMLDENRPIKWKLMQYETSMYMRRNNYKFETCAKQLLKPKSYYQKLESILKNRRL
jgi:calcium-independent phospholipase A2-gamma